ncbi:Choline kinase alpha, putative [Perkinsus marinus ATCC 50983]|uniref:ethanolamine kinase n=1 Tax=Perkinsus marinus (strain ATCC 50983 / TXsc) TaxID=423536 RepID=C5K8I3_PERM5|nr:Choline kinase alpha, putative [Perkinsus marinus ATCC 50983]EER19190.1 Choline kinase alpha, putative [Perkinsus marinus ATCC 50983]|eukprot:XP_002787394.1 Choline kinase alpha, putative [Perkinsus marinus ATCC 50983]
MAATDVWTRIPRFEDTINPTDILISQQLERLCRECLLRYNDDVNPIATSMIEALREKNVTAGVTKVTGGITNSLFKVEFSGLEDNATSPASNAPTDSTTGSSCEIDNEGSRPDHLPVCLVRIFGEAGSSIIDRDEENRIFNHLSTIGFGPTLFGIFQNGRIEEFFTRLRPLEPLEMVSEKWTPLIARRLRYMHSLKPAMVEDGPNVPDLWRTIESYAAKGRELFNASPEDEEGDFMTMLDSVEREAKWLERTIQSRETANVCPLEQIVFCHNDLLSGNILVPKDGSNCQLKFIDYEYCAFNPAAADIANHFAAVVESMLIVNDDYDVEKYFPSKELQLLFLRNYLTEDEYSSLDEGTMLETIRLYAMAAELRWCAWSVIQHFEQDRSAAAVEQGCDDDEDDEDAAFDYENYGKARLQGYFDLKNSTTEY